MKTWREIQAKHFTMEEIERLKAEALAELKDAPLTAKASRDRLEIVVKMEHGDTLDMNVLRKIVGKNFCEDQSFCVWVDVSAALTKKPK